MIPESAAPHLKTLATLMTNLKDADENNRVSLNLVPSETRLSPLAHSVLSSDFYNRYFFNVALKSDFWEFRGGQLIGESEAGKTIPILKYLGKCEYVCVRPLSGLNTTLIVLSALAGSHGKTVVTVSSETGGHYAMPNIVQRLGYKSKLINIKFGQANEIELCEVLKNNDVSLVYVDFQNACFPLDVGSFSRVIGEVSPETLLHIDASHILGLILGEAHPNPLSFGADSFGGSTHKSFPGPHKGVVFTNQAQLSEAIDNAHFDFVSSHHFAETIALGISALEFAHFGKKYAAAVIANAQTLATELKSNGFTMPYEAPFTQTHQVWFDGGGLNETSRISQRLFEAGIRANFQKHLPGMPDNSFRLGTNEVTFEGATNQSMVMLAKAFGYARDMDSIPLEYHAQSIRQTFAHPYYFTDLEALLSHINESL